MSRPLTGSKKQTAKGWEVSLPIHRGSKNRQPYTFRTEAAADRWLAAGRAAIEAGEPLPTPAVNDVVPGTRKRRSDGTPFRPMGERWADEYYLELGRAELDREGTVRAHINRIDAFMKKRGLVLETMVRDEVKALQASVTRTSPNAPVISVPEGLDPEGLVTMNEAVLLPGMASRPTLKRRKDEGVLVAVEKARTGHRYRIGDLYTEAVLGREGKLRRGPRTRGSLSQDVANDVMWVFEQVCAYARDHGVATPQDRESLKMHRTDKGPAPDREPVDLTRCADIAGRLHAVHQLALWLMRLLGLRIGEAYGIRVCDLLDQGPGLHGAVTIRAQGGRQHQTRGPGGSVVRTDRVERVKNTNSRRVIVVPPTLMDLLRAAVAIFHTDAEGNVRVDARLIPGLRTRDSGGQSAFRTALAAAARAARVDCTADEETLEEVFSCTPHDMRRSILSDLDRSKVKDTHIQRLAGHIPGTAVLHRHYLLDDPKLRPGTDIATLLQREVDAELPNGLVVPTMVRCTTGQQKNLAVDGQRIDVELVERGWLIVPTDDVGDPLLSTAEAAKVLDVTAKTARLWMAEGLLPSVHWADRANGVERRSRASDVIKLRDKLRDTVTLKRVADEVQQPYHTVYQFVRAQGLTLEPWGARDYLVPAPTHERLRAHYAEQAALHARAMPLSVAASTLDLPAGLVERLVGEGSLVTDEKAHDGRRMVTRESVELARRTRPHPRKAATRVPDDLVPWDRAMEVTGLAEAELSDVVATGLMVHEQHQRRRHVTRSSLLSYMVEHAPERLMLGF